MDCLRQTSQNKCPHFVDTKVRPDLVKVLLLSMQIGQVMSGELAGLGTRAFLSGGVDGNIITSLSSDSDIQMASLCFTLSCCFAVAFIIDDVSVGVATGDVKSTTAGSSLSEVRSTTLDLLSVCPPESVLSHREDPVELSDDVDMWRLERSSLKDEDDHVCKIGLAKCSLTPTPTPNNNPTTTTNNKQKQ